MSRTGSQQGEQTQQVDVLELDHLIGFNGKNQSMCFFHPQDSTKIIYAVGGLVVIENVNDKHEQSFLRGHDMPVSALAISPSGNFVASGQIGSKYTKTKEAPVTFQSSFKKLIDDLYLYRQYYGISINRSQFKSLKG